MIEIKAITEGDETKLELTVKGSAKEIGREAAEIMANLPLSLADHAEGAFLVMRKEFAAIMEAKQRGEVETITEVHNEKYN